MKRFNKTNGMYALLIAVATMISITIYGSIRLIMRRSYLFLMISVLMFFCSCHAVFATDDYELGYCVLINWENDCASEANSACNMVTDDNRTVFSFKKLIDSDVQKIWIGGDDTYILDMETGYRYAARCALNSAKLNCYNVIRGYKSKVLLFQIEFPRLPRSVRKIKIYGIPEQNSSGENFIGQKVYDVAAFKPTKGIRFIDYPELYLSPLTEYDNSYPVFKTPKLKEKQKKYDRNNPETYPVYINPPLVFPIDNTQYPNEKSHLSIWCTKDTTYVVFVVECKQNKTLLYINSLETLALDRNEKKRIISAFPYPIDKYFYIDGTPGDFVPIVLRFPPLPLGTNQIEAYVMEDYWLRSVRTEIDSITGEKTIITEVNDNTCYIGQLKENRQYLKTFVDNDGGKIVR